MTLDLLINKDENINRSLNVVIPIKIQIYLIICLISDDKFSDVFIKKKHLVKKEKISSSTVLSLIYNLYSYSHNRQLHCCSETSQYRHHDRLREVSLYFHLVSLTILPWYCSHFKFNYVFFKNMNIKNKC